MLIPIFFFTEDLSRSQALGGKGTIRHPRAKQEHEIIRHLLEAFFFYFSFVLLLDAFIVGLFPMRMCCYAISCRNIILL
jgi:hypothetical protein